MKKDKMPRAGRRIFKILILLSTAYAMVRMWHWKIGFTFFTQLSNLYIAAVAGGLLVWDNRFLRANKFAATVSIAVTFLVYLTVIGPLMPGGLLAAYREDHWASLFMHLITPVLALADFMLNDSGKSWGRRHALYALIPPAAWFLLILLLGRLGVSWHGMAAPYPFLNYRAPAGWFGFRPDTLGANTLGLGVFYAMLLLLSAFLLMGRLLLWAAGKRREKSGAKADL